MTATEESLQREFGLSHAERRALGILSEDFYGKTHARPILPPNSPETPEVARFVAEYKRSFAARYGARGEKLLEDHWKDFEPYYRALWQAPSGR